MLRSKVTDIFTLHPMLETSSSDTCYHSLENRCQRLASLRYWTRLAKRRAALLESNRPRNNQPETHRDDEVRGEGSPRATPYQEPLHRIDRFPHALENS